MSNPYRLSPDFWSRFARETWEQTHCVFREPFSAPLASAEEAFQGLVAVAEGIRSRALSTAAVRMYCERGRLLLHEDLDACLPVSDDRSADGFLRRLQADGKGEHVGIVVDSIPRHIPGIWKRSRDFLVPFFDQIEVPWRPVHLSLFAGNYPSTPFGVHTDYTPTFQFVIQGHKTMHLWSEETWLSKPRDEWTYHESLEDATTVHLETGDVLYWPANTYHVGECDEMSMSFSLGLFPSSIEVNGKQMRHGKAPPNRIAARVERSLGELLGHIPEPSHPLARSQVHAVSTMLPLGMLRALNSLRDLCDDTEFHSLCVLDYLEWMSAFGFDDVPGPARGVALGDEDLVMLTDYPVIWSYGADETPEILLAANGHSERLPAHPELIRMISRINSGSAHRVRDLLSEFDGEVISIADTEIEVTKEGARSLLELLFALDVLMLAG